jgi:thioredoxin-like negative regulator of GroEL
MFCGNMGVQSFPKMIVFEDGQWRENMDGFYPLEVVREMFKRYNRTTVEETKKEENKVEEKVV